MKDGKKGGAKEGSHQQYGDDDDDDEIQDEENQVSNFGTMVEYESSEGSRIEINETGTMIEHKTIQGTVVINESTIINETGTMIQRSGKDDENKHDDNSNIFNPSLDGNDQEDQ